MRIKCYNYILIYHTEIVSFLLFCENIKCKKQAKTQKKKNKRKKQIKWCLNLKSFLFLCININSTTISFVYYFIFYTKAKYFVFVNNRKKEVTKKYFLYEQEVKKRE